MKNFCLSLSTRSDFIEQINKLLSGHPNQKHYVHITKKERKRGLSANAQQHVFYQQIAEYYSDRTPLEVKNMCKDLFGIGILLNSEDNREQIEFFLAKLEYYRYSYEKKMKLIQCLPITSLFNTKESKLYMDSMIEYFNGLDIEINYQDE